MHLLAFSAFLLLISFSYGADNTTLSTGIVENPLGNSVLIAIPTSCAYSGQNATLYVTGPVNQSLSLTMPQCRLKRDLIVVNNPQNGNSPNINVGYQVLGLNQSTTYTAWYNVGGTDLNPVVFTTKTVAQAPPTTFRRSGGMVVITVLLSIAMFLLVPGLIVALVLGGKSKK